MIRSEKSSSFYFIIILLVCFFAFFINNQVIPPDYMESRNLATAQEMVKKGNYLTPTMNDELRLEKPPLPTWIAAGVEHLIPDSVIAQRVPAGLAATMMIFFLFFIVCRISRNKDIALIAALVCATCFNVMMMGRTATWDIYCHAFMLGAIYFMIVAFEEKGAQWGNYFGAGIFMGLSFLSKGPVSFFALLLPFLISYIIIFRPKIKGKVGSLFLMILVCLVVSFWWYGYIWLFHQDMLLSVANKETSSWLDHNVRPFYYYWKFPAEAGIWAILWLTSIIYFFSKRKNHDKRDVFAFSIIWFILALVLLSAIPEKKTRYLLPILIPGAITVAMYFYYSAKYAMTKPDKVIFRINTILIALVLFALPAVLYVMFVEKGFISDTLFVVTSVLSVVIAVFMLSGILKKGNIKVMRVFSCIILTMFVVEGLCMIPIRRTFINDDRHSIRMLRTNQDVQGLPFYHNADQFMRMELVYEANQIIKPMDLSNDSLVYNSLPFVLVSSTPIDSLLKGKHVDIKYIDTFDNNWRQRESRRYNQDLVSNVAIIRAAKDTIAIQDSINVR